MIPLLVEVFISLLYLVYETRSADPLKFLIIAGVTCGFHCLMVSIDDGLWELISLSVIMIIGALWFLDYALHSDCVMVYKSLKQRIIHPYYKLSLSKICVVDHLGLMAKSEVWRPMMVAALCGLSCKLSSNGVNIYSIASPILIGKFAFWIAGEKRWKLTLCSLSVPIGVICGGIFGWRAGSQIFATVLVFTYYLSTGSLILNYCLCIPETDRVLHKMRHSENGWNCPKVTAPVMSIEYFIKDRFGPLRGVNHEKILLTRSDEKVVINEVDKTSYDLLSCKLMCSFKLITILAGKRIYVGDSSSLTIIAEQSCIGKVTAVKDSANFEEEYPALAGSDEENAIMYNCLEGISKGKNIIILPKITAKLIGFMEYSAKRGDKVFFVTKKC